MTEVKRPARSRTAGDCHSQDWQTTEPGLLTIISTLKPALSHPFCLGTLGHSREGWTEQDAAEGGFELGFGKGYVQGLRAGPRAERLDSRSQSSPGIC